MFRRIVVGADGSPEAKDAVVLGAAIATATGAGLTLLGAFGPFLVGDAADRRRTARSVDRQLSALREEFAPSAHVTSVADGNAARALLAEAHHWHASLIIIGSSQHASVGRCALGQTVRRLVHKMPAALALAKRGLHEEAFSLSNIAVGYDGGCESDRALQFADRLAVCADAELLIETVAGDLTPPSLPAELRPRELVDELRESGEIEALKISKHAAERTTTRSHVSGHVGDPGSVLRDISEDVDLMVIGSRRWGLLPRVLLGGVGETLVADCGASLIIVNRPSDREMSLHKSPHEVPEETPASTAPAGRTAP